MTTFIEGRERNIALGVWGAVGGFGAAAGVLFGGILTDALSWPWIFYVNVPVGVAAAIITPILLRESRDARAKRFDALGALLVTSGLSVAVFGITQANGYGWSSGKTIGIFAAAVALLAAFGVWETRVAVAGTSIVWANVAAQLVTRVGVKPVLTAGMVFLTAGLVYFAQVSPGGSYVGDLLPGFLLIGIALGFSFVPISIASLVLIRGSELGPAAEPVAEPALETA